MYNDKPKKFAAKATKKTGFRPSFGKQNQSGVGKFGEQTVVKAKFSAKSGGKKFKKFAK